MKTTPLRQSLALAAALALPTVSSSARLEKPGGELHGTIEAPQVRKDNAIGREIAEVKEIPEEEGREIGNLLRVQLEMMDEQRQKDIRRPML